VGSIFEIGVYLDTKGKSINTLDLKVTFDTKKLAVSKPSGGKSIFGAWVTSPSYDNYSGVLTMSGVVPDGIVTSSGLITTISFKVLASGDTSINIANSTSAYLNDGNGTKANLTLGRAQLTFQNQISEGVLIHSDTHPFTDNWYNNNNPIFSWDNFKQSDGYAILLDSNPSTVPTNEITTNKNTFSYSGISNGIWYFHIKSKDIDGWGNVAHYKIKIDTNPPEEFMPVINKIIGANRDEYLLIFSAEDVLSGVDHYEVGILNNNRDKNTLPVFVEGESPYVLPTDGKENIKVVVKAFDTAGNVTEGTASLYPDRNNMYIVIVFVLAVVLLLLHFLFGHHIARNIKRAYFYFRNISNKDENNP
jgi:hypothetical protein